jgi:hypothetical protein
MAAPTRRLPSNDASSERSAGVSPPPFVLTGWCFVARRVCHCQVLAAPYWEYTIDSEKYGDMWSVFSPIFSDDFFGAYPVNSPFVVDTGPLAYLGLPKNWSSPEHSPYGYIMDNFSPDPTPYLTRSASMCGIQTRAPLPTCNKLKKVLNTTNMYDFRNMVETFYHAEVSGCRLCLVGVRLVCEF